MNQTFACEMAMNKNFTCCPLSKITSDFYGTLILKFENGRIKHSETTFKEKH